MSIRKERLADQIRDLIAQCFAGGQLDDPRVKGATITHVKLSGDLQLASVYFRVYDEKTRDGVKSGLESCRGLLRRVLADHLDLRRVPQLRFFYDESVEHGAKIEQLLRQMRC